MPLKHVLLGFLIVFSWGLHFSIIKLGLGSVSPWVMVSLRMIFSALVFLPFITFSWPRFKQIIPFGIWVNAIHLPFLFLTIQATDPATTVLVLNGYIVLTVLVSWAFLKEKVSTFTWIGVAISFAGLVVIYGAPSMTMMGVIYSIPMIIGLMMREFTLKKVAKPTPAELLGYGALIPIPIIVPYTLIFHMNEFAALAHTNLWAVSGVLFYQIFVMGAALVGWQWILQRNDVNKAVPINLAQPVFAVLGAIVLVGQQLTPQLLIGGAFVVVGLAAHLLYGKRKKIVIEDAVP